MHPYAPVLVAEVTAEQIITIMTPAAVAVTALINYLASRDAAKKVVEVKQDLSANHVKAGAMLNSIKETGEVTHQLVNARMDAMIKSLAHVRRRLAQMTKDPDDIAAADAAEAEMKSNPTTNPKRETP